MKKIQKHTGDEMTRWYHQLSEHEFEQTLGNSEGQGSLACLVHGVAESDMTERLNKSNNNAQCMQASLMAQQVKNVPAMQETQKMRVQSWVRMIPCRRKIATHSNILA